MWLQLIIICWWLTTASLFSVFSIVRGRFTQKVFRMFFCFCDNRRIIRCVSTFVAHFWCAKYNASGRRATLSPTNYCFRWLAFGWTTTLIFYSNYYCHRNEHSQRYCFSKLCCRSCAACCSVELNHCRQQFVAVTLILLLMMTTLCNSIESNWHACTSTHFFRWFLHDQILDEKMEIVAEIHV